MTDWRKSLTFLTQMPSPLKPANPIRLKWATYSQHTRELRWATCDFIIIILFFPSCQLLWPSSQTSRDAAAPCYPRIPPSRGGRKLNYWKSVHLLRSDQLLLHYRKSVHLLRSDQLLLHYRMLLDSLVAVLPPCTIMFQSNNSWNCQTGL